MTTLSLRLPDSYHAMVKEITAKEEISITSVYLLTFVENIVEKGNIKIIYV